MKRKKNYREPQKLEIPNVEELCQQTFQKKLLTVKQQQCFGCITQYSMKYQIPKEKKNHLFFISSSSREISIKNTQCRSQKNSWQQQLLKYLCLLLNNKVGYLMIGGKSIKGPMSIINGIQLSSDDRKDFVATVKRLISTFIMPNYQLKYLLTDSDQFDRVFQIRFLPIRQQNSDQERKNRNNTYVIRIKVNTTKVISYRTFFYLNVKRLGSEDSDAVSSYVLQDGKIKHIASKDITQKIEKMFKVKKQQIQRRVANLHHHSANIKCKQIESQQELLKLDQQELQNDESTKKNKIIKYERKFNYESLIVVAKNKLNQFRSVVDRLKEKKIRFHVEEMKVHEFSASPRLVFYVSHQKNYEAMNKFFKKEQQQIGQNQILIFNVRKNLVLLNFQDQQNALNSLVQKFKSQFGANFLMGLKRSYNPKLMAEVYNCYFLFQTKMQASFAFVLMQEKNIKANFVNESKTEGTICKVC